MSKYLIHSLENSVDKTYLVNGWDKGIPPAYLEVDYLTFNGSQYILTNISGSPNKYFDVKFLLSNLNSHYVIIGAPTLTNPFLCNRILYHVTQGCFVFLGNGSSISDAIYDTNTVTTSTIFTAKTTPTTFLVNDVVHSMSMTFTQTTNNIIIGGNRLTDSASATVEYKFLGKMYYAKIYDSSMNLIGNFIPCYRKSDSKPGMYDTVSGAFFTNAGSGEFTVGPDATVLNNVVYTIKDTPIYSYITGIQGDGTAYIDTLLTVSSDYLKVIITLKGLSFSGSDMDRFAGCVTGSHYSLFTLGGDSNTYNGCFRDAFMNTSRLGNIYTNRPWYNKKLEITSWAKDAYQKEYGSSYSFMLYKDLDTLTITQSNSGNTASFNSSSPYTYNIFRWGGTNSNVPSSHVIIYHFTLYDGTSTSDAGTILKFNGSPVKLNVNITADMASDNLVHYAGEIGFLDSVTGKFFGNAASSGSFIEII